MKEKIESLLKELREIQAETQKKLQKSIKELFSEFWANNPDIQTVVWTQYAPYFNDGDACVFAVHDPVFTNFRLEDSDTTVREVCWGDYEDEEKNHISVQAWTVEKDIEDFKLNANVDSIKSLSSFLCSDVVSDVMENTFGSDSLVIATREGFEVQEYEHN
jgi:hypothetical protein